MTNYELFIKNLTPKKLARIIVKGEFNPCEVCELATTCEGSYKVTKCIEGVTGYYEQKVKK